MRISTVGERVFGRVAREKPAQALGDPDQSHTYTFIGDFARALAVLGEREEALGEVWHVPSARTLSTRQFVELVAAQAGQRMALQVTPGWVIRALGVVNPTMRAGRRAAVSERARVRGGPRQFARAFGAESTPHAEAIQRTLEWFRSGSSSDPEHVETSVLNLKE